MRIASALFLALLFAARAAPADLILLFSGTVTEVDDPDSRLGDAISVGDPMTGSLTIDPVGTPSFPFLPQPGLAQWSSPYTLTTHNRGSTLCSPGGGKPCRTESP